MCRTARSLHPGLPSSAAPMPGKRAPCVECACVHPACPPPTTGKVRKNASTEGALCASSKPHVLHPLWHTSGHSHPPLRCTASGPTGDGSSKRRPEAPIAGLLNPSECKRQSLRPGLPDGFWPASPLALSVCRPARRDGFGAARAAVQPTGPTWWDGAPNARWAAAAGAWARIACPALLLFLGSWRVGGVCGVLRPSPAPVAGSSATTADQAPPVQAHARARTHTCMHACTQTLLE